MTWLQLHFLPVRVNGAAVDPNNEEEISVQRRVSGVWSLVVWGDGPNLTACSATLTFPVTIAA